jgi:hypothetical protein
MEDIAHISGTDRVIESLGYWPSFHDAEVISFSAERALPFKHGETAARLAVHVRQYKTVGAGTPNYEQVLHQSILIKLLFKGACELDVSDFNHQNVIDAINVTSIESNENDLANLLVSIPSIWGFGGTFRCQSAEVESIDVLPNT